MVSSITSVETHNNGKTANGRHATDTNATPTHQSNGGQQTTHGNSEHPSGASVPEVNVWHARKTVATATTSSPTGGTSPDKLTDNPHQDQWLTSSTWPAPNEAAEKSSDDSQRKPKLTAPKGRGQWKPFTPHITHTTPAPGTRNKNNHRNRAQQKIKDGRDQEGQPRRASQSRHKDGIGAHSVKPPKDTAASAKSSATHESRPRQSSQSHTTSPVASHTPQTSRQSPASASNDSSDHPGSFREGFRGRRGRGRGRGRGGFRRADYMPLYPTYPFALPPPPPPMPFVTIDKTTLKTFISQQIEYYFSIDNLCKDVFLRSKMDRQGYVDLNVLSNFNRVKALTTDTALIREALEACQTLELKDDKVRKREGWETWILPATLEDTASPQHPPTVTSHDQTPTSLDADNRTSSTHVNDNVEDIDDDAIARVVMITLEKKGGSQTPLDGVHIDDKELDMINAGLCEYETQLLETKSRSTDQHGPVAKEQSNLRDAPPSAGDTSASSISRLRFYPFRPASLPQSILDQRPPGWATHAGWVWSHLKDKAIPARDLSLGNGKARIPQETPHAVPTRNQPSHKLLQEKGFVQHSYEAYHALALAERKRLGGGQSHAMDTLVHFWSYFLQDHFNKPMYNEFKQIAVEDANQNNRYGLACLFRFYVSSLEKQFRQDIFNDFQTLTLADYENGRLDGLEKLWTYTRRYNDLHQNPLNVSEPLEKLLSPYSSVQDFKNARLPEASASGYRQ